MFTGVRRNVLTAKDINILSAVSPPVQTVKTVQAVLAHSGIIEVSLPETRVATGFERFVQLLRFVRLLRYIHLYRGLNLNHIFRPERALLRKVPMQKDAREMAVDLDYLNGVVGLALDPGGLAALNNLDIETVRASSSSPRLEALETALL